MRRDYDPDTANQMLDDAGYPDSDGDGVPRVQGRADQACACGPIKETPEAATGLQADRRLVEGRRHRRRVQRPGHRASTSTDIWGYKGDTFYPDFDAYYWEWDGYFDPGQTLTCFTPAQIEGWNEFSWDNAEYGRLDASAGRARWNADKRAEYIYADAAGHVRGRAVLHYRPPVQAPGLPHVDVGQVGSSPGNGGKDGPEFAFLSASIAVGLRQPARPRRSRRRRRTSACGSRIIVARRRGRRRSPLAHRQGPSRRSGRGGLAAARSHGRV